MIEASPPARAAAAQPIACPYLGLADDERTHFAFATTAHRCHSGSHPQPIEETHQGSFCLTASYPACRRYVVPTAAATAAPAALAVAPARAAGPLAVASDGVGRLSGSNERRGLVVRAAVILVAALAVVLVAARFLGPGTAPSAGPSGASGSSPTASLAASTPSPRPTPTASVALTGGPTASPTIRASARPTIHIVVRGETLTSIARFYGVTVAAIQKANGITDPSLIIVGQRLIIPVP